MIQDRTPVPLRMMATMFAGVLAVTPAQAVYRSPFDIAFSPNGQTLAVSDRTQRTLTVLNATTGKIEHEVRLEGEPTGLVWAGPGPLVYVAEYGAGTVAEVDVRNGQVVRRLSVGHGPIGLAFVRRRHTLVVANSTTHSVSIVDLRSGKQRARIPVSREPYFLTITPDEATVIVGNLLPAVPATDPKAAAVVSLIDLDSAKRMTDIALPPGSTVVRDIAVSPDGRWAYVLHTVGRFNVPTTQIERGWVNTNAFSILDLTSRRHVATLLLDNLAEGAADPWGAAISDDGSVLWISLSGVHQLARIDLAGLHDLLDGKLGDRPWLAKAGPYVPGTQSIWQEIKDDPKRRAGLVNDLTALYAANLIKRIPVPGRGPRGLSLSPDGKRIAVVTYFSGSVTLFDAEQGKLIRTLSLGPSGTPDLVRRGEIVFHDATICFQHWMSCATCHPNNGRVDGFNWDLLNDGLGNPKNVKSLLWAGKTPPSMARGIRANMDVAALAGFRHILFVEPEPEVVDAARAYIRSLEPEVSPHRRPDGSLTEAGERGKVVFESEKARWPAAIRLRS